MSGADENGGNGSKPQLQIWDDEGRETALGLIDDGDGEWKLLVVVEPAASDLVRGRLSFRRGEERYDTASVLVEDSAEGVIERAAQLPKAMILQLLASARDSRRPHHPLP